MKLWEGFLPSFPFSFLLYLPHLKILGVGVTEGEIPDFALLFFVDELKLGPVLYVISDQFLSRALWVCLCFLVALVGLIGFGSDFSGVLHHLGWKGFFFLLIGV